MAHKYNILYVDDEQDNLLAFRSIFRRHYNVSVAIGPEKAITMLESSKYDVVLTDQRMPYMTGVELCKYINQHYPTIPCMIVTGYPDQAVIETAIGNGQIGKFIAKPWNAKDLKDEIDAIVAY